MIWRDMKATTELGRTYRALCRTTWYTSNRRVKTITDFNDTGDDGVLGGIRWSKSKQSAPHFRQTTTSTSPYSRIIGRTHSWHHTNSVQALKPRECWPVGLLTPTSNFNEVDIAPRTSLGRRFTICLVYYSLKCNNWTFCNVSNICYCITVLTKSNRNCHQLA